MGIRQTQKRETRERVVAAARLLFEETGYEHTTIRMIADRAAVSVGSVFTTFDSKIDIFNHILFEKFEGLFAELQRIAPHLKGAPCDRLASLMSIAYGVECRELSLMISHLSASYGWPDRIEQQSSMRTRRLMELFRSVLEQGVATGDLRPDADLNLFAEMLHALYTRNYRKAFYERLSVESLSALTEQQLSLVFKGMDLRPAAAAV